jgi:hypothetical protein
MAKNRLEVAVKLACGMAGSGSDYSVRITAPIGYSHNRVVAEDPSRCSAQIEQGFVNHCEKVK